MATSNFVDYVKIYCRSGKGGGGSTHFRHEKFADRGGPDGGNGGRGGHIILRGSTNQWTLLHLKYKRHIFAEDGENGSGALRTGAEVKMLLSKFHWVQLQKMPKLANLFVSLLKIIKKLFSFLVISGLGILSLKLLPTELLVILNPVCLGLKKL
jgi:hypothetical protein